MGMSTDELHETMNTPVPCALNIRALILKNNTNSGIYLKY